MSDPRPAAQEPECALADIEVRESDRYWICHCCDQVTTCPHAQARQQQATVRVVRQMLAQLHPKNRREAIS
jgi:hypothetical protein